MIVPEPNNIPLALYIHFPWCAQKCPYCDFNSHSLKQELPEEEYLQALKANLAELKEKFGELIMRPIVSIFMGGGTPSLFSPNIMGQLLDFLSSELNLKSNLEITMEANPITLSKEKLAGFKAAGINRLSIGVQSFDDQSLKILGRLHDGKIAKTAVIDAKACGFENINLDLMYGLRVGDSLADLNQAIDLNPEHISWYQLTLEPNTYFHKYPPNMLDEDSMVTLETTGRNLLKTHGYNQYEVSAYSKTKPSMHNLNYWQFGDYLALGAGAHGKISSTITRQITRFVNYKHPKQFLDPDLNFIAKSEAIPQNELAFEFMLNALRLNNGVPTSFYSERTFLSTDSLQFKLNKAKEKQLLLKNSQIIQATDLGHQYLNDLTEVFLD